MSRLSGTWSPTAAGVRLGTFLQKLNHTQAVEPHRDALIAHQFDVQPGFRLRVSGFPDLLMPDHDEASDRERVVVVGVVEPDSAA